jgi:ankyrin repeat protein
LTGQYPENLTAIFENKNTEVESFFTACQNDEYHLVGSMLEQNKLLVTERNHKLETGLHIAIREQSSRKLCELLLKYGSDVHTTDLNGDSCIDLASRRKKDKELIRVIMDY